MKLAENKTADLTVVADFLDRNDWVGLDAHFSSLAVARGLGPEEAVYRAIALAFQGRSDDALESLSADALADVRARKVLRNQGVQKALQQDRADIAVLFATRLAEATEGNVESLVLLGRTLTAAGRDQDAGHAYDRAALLEPGNADVATRRIAERLRAGRNSEGADVARDLPDDHPSSRLQLYRLTAFMRAGDRDAGSRLVTRLQVTPPVNADLTALAARWLIREGLVNDALKLARSAMAVGHSSPQLQLIADEAASSAAAAPVTSALPAGAPDAGSLAIRLGAALKAGRLDEAMTLARNSVEFCAHDRRFAKLCLTALLRGGDAHAAAAVAGKLFEAGTSDPDLAVLAVRALLRVQRPEDAVAHAESVLNRSLSTGRLRLALARAMFAAGRPFEAILPHVEAAKIEGRDDPAVLQALGKISLGLGNYENAISALRQASAAGGGNIFLMAKALKQARRYQEAADIMMEGAAEHGQSRNWRRHATAALSLAGRADQAKAVYTSLVNERRARLAATFEAHLASVEQQPSPESIPQARVDWARSVVERLTGQLQEGERAAWERRALWGFKADRAILDWVECRPDAISEVAALLTGYEEGGRLLKSLLARGNGLFIASAHIGLMYAGPVVLEAAKVPFKVVAQMPRVSSATYAKHLISTFDQSRTAVIRQITDALKDGKAVTITVDASMNAVADRVPWQGVEVIYTDVVATFSFRRKVPSVFAQPYWHNGQICFVVRQLPEPVTHEAEAAFVARWRSAYFDELLDFFRRGPENLRLAEGIWRTIPG